ncbi:MAG: TauD/TfdA family dioxygenase [Rhodospirillales bacterium]|nr:TauD/TfdA family dioxygenase [Rhodospirillales bacterium]
MTNREIQIEVASPAVGCEISGVDLSGPLSAPIIAAIRQALLDYGVVFFRNQELTPAQQLSFCGCFGEPDEYSLIKGLPGYPTVTPVIKLANETINFGGLWHSDTTYLERPPMGSVLHARELPPIGGDTLFANMYLAFETLSDGLKAMLGGLNAVNSAYKARVSDTRSPRLQDAGKDVGDKILEAVHPVVRTHPETGRRALYVNRGHTVRFEGMTEDESAGLLEYLFRHQTREEFTCRFKWSPGAVAFWDNRCTQHYPLNDYTGHRRVMNRVTLKGDVPR